MRRSLAPALLSTMLATSLLLTGCGGDEESDADEPGTGAADTTSEFTPPADDTDECPFADVAQVSEAAGFELTVTAGGEGGCFLTGSSDIGADLTISITPTEIQIDPEDYAEGSREVCEGEITEVEAGDEAFACEAFGIQGLAAALLPVIPS